jgi:hypothetical protein
VTRTVVATANIEYRLPLARAHEALQVVLAHEPDLVGLQEWHLPRVPSLRRVGSLVVPPAAGMRFGDAAAPYAWTGLLVGGCAVGARTDRYVQLGARAVRLSWPGFADRPDRPLGLEPPRLAAVGVYRDRYVDRSVALVSYHLVPGVQRAGAYRSDRPRLVARHRHEHRRLQDLVAALLAAGHVVHAVGDANVDGLRIDGLTSCWQGRPAGTGTLGRRRVDDVQGPGPAESVELLSTPSDHRALVVTRPDHDFGPADSLR